MVPTNRQPAMTKTAAHVEQEASSLEEIAARTQTIVDAGRFQPKDEDGLERLARRYYWSGMLPDSYYPKDFNKRWDEWFVNQGVAKAYLAMLKGAVLGIHPSEAIWQIHVINGRPTLSADLMFGRMLATGILRRDDFTLEADKTRCKIVIGIRTRLPNERLVIEAKYEDFKHLHKKENWSNDPEGMLVARCKSRAARRWAPDVYSGMYASEEMRDLREDRNAGKADEQVEAIMAMVGEQQPDEPPPPLVELQASGAEAPVVDVVAALVEEIGKLSIAEMKAPSEDLLARCTKAKSLPGGERVSKAWADRDKVLRASADGGA